MLRSRTARLRQTAGALFPWVGVSILALAMLPAPLAAQEPQAAQPPPAVKPADAGAKAGDSVPGQGTAANAGAANPGAANTAEPAALGVILVAAAKLRCWPTELSPLYPETLAKDAVVGVGKSEGGYREVILPRGPLGYVHKDFAVPADNGTVRTKGKAVAFRYRPRASEAPVDTLVEGTELHVVGDYSGQQGQQGDWWQVRCPLVKAWLPEAEVQVAATPTPAMREAYQTLAKAEQAQFDTWLKQLADKAEKTRREEEARGRLATIATQFENESKKPAETRDFTAVEAALGQFKQELAKDSPLQASIATLQKNIDDGKWFVEATRVAKQAPPPAKDTPQIAPEVEDSLARFNSIGWLRWQGGLTGPGQFVIEKGGQTLFVVTCSSSRYDLALFVDREVGLQGRRTRPNPESMRVLDVTKIEVLGAAVQ
jgi:hypothetical protein